LGCKDHASFEAFAKDEEVNTHLNDLMVKGLKP